MNYIDIALADGATLVLGGAASTRPECGKGWFVEPNTGAKRKSLCPALKRFFTNT